MAYNDILLYYIHQALETFPSCTLMLFLNYTAWYSMQLFYEDCTTIVTKIAVKELEKLKLL